MSQRRPTPKRSAPKRAETNAMPAAIGQGRLARIGIIMFAALIVCSLLGGALLILPLDWLGDDAEQADNFVNPNEDFIEEQRAIVEADPGDLDAVLLLANVLGNTGELTEAIPWYEQAIAMAPDDGAIRLDFARALSDGGLTSDAEIQFQRALDLDPDNQGALYYLAAMYLDQDEPRTAEAISLLDRAIAVDRETQIAELAQQRLDSIAPSASPEATP